MFVRGFHKFNFIFYSKKNSAAPSPSVTKPAFIQFNQSSGPVSGSAGGRVGCDTGAVQLVEVG